MTTVDDALISAAASALGVSDKSAIGAVGGQKAVRLVTRGTDQLVMKVMKLSSSAPDTLARAEREVELLGSLASPRVVNVKSDMKVIGTPPEGVAWLEEYLDGTDLTVSLGPQWAWADVRTMGLQVAEGLTAGHAVGVIHRDLSPNNVRRLASGDYKVLDFGFARHTLRSGITTGGQPGTPGYLTPEHLNSYSGVPMPASDVFQVGILMYEALSGKSPIPYLGDPGDYFGRLSGGVMIDLATLRPDLSDTEIALVRRCLHPQPARRFRDGKRLADAIGAS